MKNNTICVVIPIYINTNIHLFKKAIESIVQQSHPADEILIICDGLISTQLNNLIKTFSNKYSYIKIIRYDHNKGPGYARDYGIKCTSCDYIAIMDSDDVSTIDRLAIQYEFMQKNNDISLCGGLIRQLDDNNHKISIRNVPMLHSEILKTIKIKSPINNVTAFFRRKDYLETDGYAHIRSSEDYALWARLIYKEKKLQNLPHIFVDVNFDIGSLSRRTGLAHFKNDLFTQKELLNFNLITRYQFYKNILKYFIFRCILHKNIKKILYKYYLRK
ncbi:TPA: glycosyltransferase [Proteus mirabilis]